MERRNLKDPSSGMLSTELIEAARRGKLQALVQLDCRGLLLGADESAEQYASRLERLRANISRMEEALEKEGAYGVEGISVEESRRIPPDVFREARHTTEFLYGFSVDWVPGFFITPPGVFFGGCAFHFYPDFFALFIIRTSFRTRQRWLIYSRRELLAHELCHVARIGLESRIFEETFAYQTASSRFRKLAGGVFRSPADSFVFLGSTLLLLGSQLCRTAFVPRLWVWPFWALVGGVFAFLALRHGRYSLQFARAVRSLRYVSPRNALQILFRCTDTEVQELARMSRAPEIRDWLESKTLSSLRWQVVNARFLDSEDTATDHPGP